LRQVVVVVAAENRVVEEVAVAMEVVMGAVMVVAEGEVVVVVVQVRVAVVVAQVRAEVVEGQVTEDEGRVVGEEVEVGEGKGREVVGEVEVRVRAEMVGVRVMEGEGRVVVGEVEVVVEVGEETGREVVVVEAAGLVMVTEQCQEVSRAPAHQHHLEHQAVVTVQMSVALTTHQGPGRTALRSRR
jgi:hypothetical protein